MGKSSPETPAAPDPYTVAGAQQKVNDQTARLNAQLNRVNENTPYGSTSYTQNGDSWTRNDTLNPDAQNALTNYYKAQGGITGQLANASNNLQGIGTQFDTSGLSGLYNPNFQQSVGPNDFSADGKRVSDSLYGQATSRLDPQFANQDESLQNKLSNQGIFQGSEAYQRAMDQQSRNKNDAYNQANYSAIQAGGQEQSRLFQDALAQGNFGNATQQQQYGNSLGNRQQMLSEMLTGRQVPLNELSTLLSAYNGGNQGGQGSQTAQVASSPSDLQGAFNNQYQGQLTGYNNRVATNNANTGAAASLGAAALMAFA